MSILPVAIDMIALPELEPYHCAKVLAIEAEPEEIERLAGFGVCLGRTVELVKRGDPLILRVYGSRIGLSARLAEAIKVEPCIKSTCGDE